jgi:Family of unknown function (DUF5681)
MPRPAPSTPPWKPGQSGNPKGRPLGNRNKLNEKFILALHDDFVKHGPAAIMEVRENQPGTYLKVIASILPRELHFKNESAFDGMTNEQLDEMLGSVRRILTARASTDAPGGKQKANGGDEPDRVH